MTKWIELYNNYADYTSDIYDISSDFESYIENISYTYDSNNGEVDIYIRMSFDNGVTWTDWTKINNSAYKSIFNDDFYNMKQAKFQYKVEMNKTGDISPVFKKFSILLIGTFTITNTGDTVCKPEIWIKKTGGSGDIKLMNETNGQVLELKNLNDGETVYIDSENEDIVSDLPMTYRYNDHNNVFLELEVGDNFIAGEGGFELDMRLQFKTLQG